MLLGHKELIEQLELRKEALIQRLTDGLNELSYDEFIEIKELYAVIYSMFHTVQKHSKENRLNLVPEGDQIAGELGEDFIIRYLKNKYPSQTTPVFTTNSTTSRDIEYFNDRQL